MDIQTDQLIFEALGKTGVVYSGASEETAEETIISPEGKYIVTWDPLDGSSIIDSNGAIGSIFGIWPKGNLMEMFGRDQVGALLSVYGSRTHCIFYNNIKDRVDELTLMKNEEGAKHWVVTHEDMQIRESGRYFSPGNTKAIKHSPGYKKAIEYWAKSNYQIRYSGGMAPDCYHIFAKREGVFSSISAMPHVPPKLRFLYEVAPISFLIEKAGGKSSDGYKSILDV